MVVKRMTQELYDSLAPLRARSVREVIEAPVIVDGKSPISEVIGVLAEANAYEAFIPLHNKVASINMRDVLGYRDISSARPSTLGKITPTLTREQNLGYAARVMTRYRLRALPVVEQNKIVGQASARAIVRIVNDAEISKVRAQDIMTPHPISVRAEDKGATAKGLMIRNNIDHLPVMQDGKLAGVVTSTHLVMAKVPSEKVGRRSLGLDALTRMTFPVIGVADRNVITSDVGDTVHAVTDLLVEMGSTYSVVMLGEEVQGIITARDVVGLLEESVEEVVPAFIVGLPDDPFEAELAKSKFTSVVKLLRRVSPEIEEARCNMKIRDKEGERRRYEVDVHLITPYERITYTNAGWDLGRMFDQASDSLKKRLAHRPSRKRRSMRYRTDLYTIE